MISISTNLLVGGLLAWIVYRIAKILIRLINDPLKRFPGPWHAKLTSLPFDLAGLRGHHVQYMHKLHQQYGPVVRFLPNEVSFSELESFKDIHRVGAGFLKAEFYDPLNIAFGKHGSIFNMRDPDLHFERRKLFVTAFRSRELQTNLRNIVKERVNFAVSQIKEEFRREAEPGGKGSVNVGKWWMLMASDVIACVSFGESFRSLENGETAHYIQATERIGPVGALQNMIGMWLWYCLEAVPWWPTKAFYDFFRTGDILMAQAGIAVDNSKAHSSNQNIFATAFSLDEEDTARNIFNDQEIRCEAGSFIAAGTQTTANTLICFTRSVLSDPDLRDLLQAELDSVSEVNDDTLKQLPVLNACLDETLRLYSAASGPLPRTVPPGGSTINGTYVPGGAVVSAPAYIVHRDPSIFADPDRFDHKRFMPDNPDVAKHRAALGAWGGGARVCIGMDLAMSELRTALATFLRECRGAKLAPSMIGATTETESMVLFTSPKSQRLDVVMAGA